MSHILGISHSKIYFMYTDQVNFMWKQFSAYIQLLYGLQFFPGDCPNILVLSYLSVDTFYHALLHTVVYGTHSGWCIQKRSKVARQLKHKVFCLVWSVLNEVLVKKAENDSPYCFSWLGVSICYLTSVSVFLICTLTTVFTLSSKYGTLQLSCLIFYSVLSTWYRVSFMRKCCRRTRITLRTEVS